MLELAGSIRRLAALALVACMTPTALAAQQVPEPIPLPRDTVDAIQGPSPAGAFVRSLIVPGWGQASHGAYLRGGIFFALQSGTWFMLIKTLAKLSEARSIEEFRVGLVRDSLLALAADDPELEERYRDPRLLELDVQQAADGDERVTGIRGLVRAREQQREDWIAMTIFVTLMSGVDALVNAHLSDFPGRVAIDPGANGKLTVGVTLPAGGKP